MATRRQRVRLPKKPSSNKVLDASAATRLIKRASPKKQKTAPAVAKKADAAVAAARKQAKNDLKQAKALIARIKSDFYDLGLILARLQQPKVHTALGYGSFGALVDAELDISRTHADNLATVATEVRRDLAESVGRTHALALVRLCRATPEADTPEQIRTKKVKLPSGDVLNVETATSRELRAAAAALRQRRERRDRRGNTTSPVERAIVEDIQTTLLAQKVPSTRVRAIATKPGEEALLEIRVPFSALSALCKAVCP